MANMRNARHLSVLVAVVLSLLICHCYGEEEEPLGHMKPFGAHREPDPVDELPGFPSAKAFMENYVRYSRPLVLRGVAEEFPAFKLWTEEYLKSNFGDLEFRLEGKHEKRGRLPVGARGLGRDTLESFIDTYHETDRYIVSELPTPMWKDVCIMPSLSCGPFVEKFVEIDMWLSGGGTSSVFHKDAYNTINCVLNGTKEWKLVAYEHQDKIYQFQERNEGIGGFSRINVSAVDMHKFPLVSQIPWSFTTIQKGDCLYLPGSMWHQVKSFGSMNLAVASLFSRFPDKKEQYDYKDCKQQGTSAERFVPLSEVDVDWQFSGHGDMSMGIYDFDAGKESLQELFAEDGKFSLRQTARAFYSAWEGGTKSQLKKKTMTMLELFRKWTGKKDIVVGDIEQLSRKALREILKCFHPAIPENTMQHEYFAVDEVYITSVIKSLVKSSDGVLKREEFLHAYSDIVGGTKTFGEEIYSRLQSGGGKDGKTSDEKDVLTEAEVKSRLRYAVFKFKSGQGEADETGFVLLEGDEAEAFVNEKDYAMSDEEWEQIGERHEGEGQEDDEDKDDDNDDSARKTPKEEL